MKNSITRKCNLMTALSLMIAALGTFSVAQAGPTDGGTGIDAWYNRFWGNQAARDAIDTCTFAALEDGENGGFVNAANSLMCHLKVDLGVTGPTGAGGVTGALSSTNAAQFVHVVVTGEDGGKAYSGYDYEAQVWGCYAGYSFIGGALTNSNCTVKTQYFPLAIIDWTKSADGAVNKGHLFMDQSVLGGGAGPMSMATYCATSFNNQPLCSGGVSPDGAPKTYNPDLYLNMVWNLGTGFVSRQLEFKLSSVFFEPELNDGAGAFNGANWYGLHQIANNGIINSAFIQATPDGEATARFAAQFDYVNNVARTGVDFETLSKDPTAKSDTVADHSTVVKCSTMVKDGPDWDYSGGGADCSSIPEMSYPDYSMDDVGNFEALATDGGATQSPVSIGDFGSMASTPDSI